MAVLPADDIRAVRRAHVLHPGGGPLNQTSKVRQRHGGPGSAEGSVRGEFLAKTRTGVRPSGGLCKNNQVEYGLLEYSSRHLASDIGGGDKCKLSWLMPISESKLRRRHITNQTALGFST